MTDATDIKALREVLCILKSVEGVRTLAAELIDQLEAAEKKNALVAGGIEAALKMQEQLEAERQRSAGSEEELHKALHREKAVERKLLAAQEELAELKGEQVPVGNPVLAYADSYRAMARQGSDSVPIWAVITDLERNIAPLFTAPQKPVVLPHGYKPYLVRSQTTATRAAMTSGGEWLHRDEVTAAIVAAGIVVKDGE